jgi:hypothetical protein
MSEPITVKARLLDAQYIKASQSVLLMLECEQGRFRSQIHRNQIASYGNRTEDEIEVELNKYVDILKYSYIGKNRFINTVFDPELDGKIKDGVKINYK